MQHTHISARQSLFDLKLGEFWQYRDLVWLFTRRSFKVSYMQTILGPLWLFINPLLTSITYVVLFGSIAKLSTDGVPQLLFYLSGHALWAFFAGCVTSNASTFTDKKGVLHSNVLPHFSNGDVITTPRAQAPWLVTDYGAVILSVLPTWQRAEAVISIAHPDFREELIRAAEEQRIWRRSNKR